MSPVVSYDALHLRGVFTSKVLMRLPSVFSTTNKILLNNRRSLVCRIDPLTWDINPPMVATSSVMEGEFSSAVQGSMGVFPGICQLLSSTCLNRSPPACSSTVLPSKPGRGGQGSEGHRSHRIRRPQSRRWRFRVASIPRPGQGSPRRGLPRVCADVWRGGVFNQVLSTQNSNTIFLII